MNTQKVTVSIIVSVFNEEQGIKNFHQALSHELSQLNDSVEVLYVNDGSTDASLKLLEEITTNSNQVKVISFSRNYGHEAAMIAGIDNAKGEFVICLDADLQHPPALIPDMIAKAKEGADVVLMKREERQDGGLIMKMFSAIFYSILNRVSPLKFEKNASDFFLISSKISSVLRKDYRERIRFLRGYIQHVGFRRAYITYNAPERVSGESKYNMGSLVSLSTEAITSFSKLPLRLGIGLGIVGMFLSLIIGTYSLVMHFIDDTPAGYTTMILTLTVVASLQFILIGFIGIYIGYLFDEIKNRPIYLIDKVIEGE